MTRGCAIVEQSPPEIKRDANAVAAVGVPYVYNVAGRVEAVGSRPMLFSACGAQPLLKVEPSTGAVTWTPASAGAAALCVQAANDYGTDVYAFTVEVAAAAAGFGPQASFTVTPDDDRAPLAASFDGTASTSDPASPLIGFRWRSGTGARPRYGATSSFEYLAPGGYQADLTVTDSYGRTAAAKRPVQVRSESGERPPNARIVASATTGVDQLAVSFSCDCTAGSSEIVGLVWDVGGELTAEEAPTISFLPGRVRVRLTVVDASGLAAHDSVMISVDRGTQSPPSCELSVDPPVADAPMASTYRVEFSDVDGSIASHSLTFEDGSNASALEIARQFPSPGVFTATLRVSDDSGLGCVDRVDAIALGGGLVPPRILSQPPPATAQCGVAYGYNDGNRLVVAGSAPLRCTAQGDLAARIDIDPVTRAVRWAPTANEAGKRSVTLECANAVGTDRQTFDVNVECAPVEMVVGCGCSSDAPGAHLLSACVIALLVAGARRRGRPSRVK